MTLAAGTRLGPYEIVAPLGAGGMGEVCKARAERLSLRVHPHWEPQLTADDVAAVLPFCSQQEYISSRQWTRRSWQRKLVLMTLLIFSLGRRASATLVLDQAFGQGGKVFTQLPGEYVTFGGVVVQGDGRIVAAGSAANPIQHVVLVRYLANGSLDTTFGTGGVLTSVFGSNGDEARAVTLQSDGRLVIVGLSSDVFNQTLFLVARYLPTGALDSSFGSGGFVTTVFTGADGGQAVGMQQDGKIVAAGYAGVGVPPGSNFAVARYNADGTLDPSFGTGGIAQIDMGGDQDEVKGLVIQQDGRIVLGGLAINAGGHNQFALARLLPDGTLDSSFGVGGRAFALSDAGCFAVALQPDQRILAAGGVGNPNSAFALIRYLPDGSLDPSFGSAGIVTTVLGGPSEAFGVVLTTDSRITVVGGAASATRVNFGVARYTSSGAPDLTLAPGGWLATEIGDSTAAHSVLLLADGRLLVAGPAIVANRLSSFALARYLEQTAAVPGLSASGLAALAVLLAAAGALVLMRHASFRW